MTNTKFVFLRHLNVCLLVTSLFRALVLTLCLDPVAPVNAQLSYLNNGVLKLEIDLDKGGTITYLSLASDTNNVINSYDLGREVQQAYYSGPDNFGDTTPPWSPWPWNPTAAGDRFGNTSQVLQWTNDTQTIYVKSSPLQWALDDVPGECTFEAWYQLSGNAVQVRNRLTNNRSDQTEYPARGQELPSIYAISQLNLLYAYTNEFPFTGDNVAEVPIGTTATKFFATENWAALLNDAQWGLGVFEPNVYTFGGALFGSNMSGGPTSSNTAYVSPHPEEIIDYNLAYQFQYSLVLGTLSDIRTYAYANRTDPLPHYYFIQDRQHWSLINATDTGYPLNGSWRVNLGQTNSYLLSPSVLWPAASVPQLFVRIAVTSTNENVAQLYWMNLGDSAFSAVKSVRFGVQPDDQFHNYIVNLAANTNYIGRISRLRFAPLAGGGLPGDASRIAFISYLQPELGNLSAFKQGNDIVITWTSYPGQDYVIQTAVVGADGSITASFVDLSPTIDAPASPPLTVTYTDTGAATNQRARYYRVRQFPAPP